MTKLVLFETGETLFAIPRSKIAHIETVSDDVASAWYRDQRFTIPYRGRYLPVIDFSRPSRPDTRAEKPMDAKTIVIKVLPQLALWADQVKGHISANVGHEMPLPPMFFGMARNCFPTVLRLKGKIALIVNVDALTSLVPGPQAAISDKAGAPSGPVTRQRRQLPSAKTTDTPAVANAS